jgi:hypothetical protein
LAALNVPVAWAVDVLLLPKLLMKAESAAEETPCTDGIPIPDLL